MPNKPETLELLRHLHGKPGHDEVKADFHQLLVVEFGATLSELDFEKRVPEVKGRIDALIGRTVFEAKSDLDKEWGDVERRMPDYLADREREEREHFVGIASDGRKWAVFERAGGKLVKVKETTLDPDNADLFLAWLDGAVALKSSLPPDALTIRSELGGGSVAFHLVDSRLRTLWEDVKHDRAVSLKRQLWAELLRLVYGREVESDALWFQHTFLVVVSKCIAVAVMQMREDDPKNLLSGETFSDAGIYGAVESDFFDWVVSSPEGEDLVRRIMAHVRRFRLSEVESDVLKILYESLIDRDERHGLGEYYTPDWLAAKIVKESTSRPLEQRVLDPACGSGTFLFHAIRNFLREAEEVGQAPELRASEVCAHVAGMDIHPVAVIIARVTYLLALAPALAMRTGTLSIPVYLGDSMQLSINQLLAGKELVIRVPPPSAGDSKSGEKDQNGREQLDFPDTFCRDPALFDKAIERMRTGSEAHMTRSQIEAALDRITEQHYRADVTDEQKQAIKDLGKTYVTFDKLRREGRDTVWAYVARNLSRPLAYSANGGWAQVLVGNPPWVAYRHISLDLQKRFKELAQVEKVYVGRVPSQNDLCALFTVRAAMLYLRSGGRLGFVLPMAALTRGQFEPLRSGEFRTSRIGWDSVWVMNANLQPLFPVPSCVVFGRRTATARPLPDFVRTYSGILPYRDASEAVADKQLKIEESVPALETAQHKGGSPYRKVFRNGATLFPRMLVFVERRSAGRLGSDLSAPFVESRRTNLEKMPWKDLPSIANRVEAEFLHPVLLGESVLPYRIFKPFEAVVPVTPKGEVLDAMAAANRGYDGLHSWMSKAEAVWEANKRSDNYSLTGLFDYFGQLSSQFPIAPLRVVYAKAGTQPAAALVRDGKSIVENLLYWCAITTEQEGEYLCAIINSETARKRMESHQARGQWGARHFDKVIFNLPIPRFNPKNCTHNALAKAAKDAERTASRLALPAEVKFQRARSMVRNVLTEAGIAKQIDDLVTRLLDE